MYLLCILMESESNHLALRRRGAAPILRGLSLFLEALRKF
jgi:hypothetical protein